MESPHKAAQREKEVNTEIPGIGRISTRWIGQRGKQDLIELADQETSRTEAQGLKVELRALADECKKALLILGANDSCDPQVQSAVSSCDRYLKNTTSKHRSTSVNQRLDDLWKSQSQVGPSGTIESATAALGQQLVDTRTSNHLMLLVTLGLSLYLDLSVFMSTSSYFTFMRSCSTAL